MESFEDALENMPHDQQEILNEKMKQLVKRYAPIIIDTNQYIKLAEDIRKALDDDRNI